MGDDISIVLTLDDQDFTVGVKNSGKLLKQFERQSLSASKGAERLDFSIDGLAGRTRDLTIILATAQQALHTIFQVTVGWQMAIMGAAGEIERLQVMMRGMSSESNMAKRELDAMADSKFVTDFAQNAPFKMEALTDAFIKFRTVGLEPTDGSMKSLTDAVATFGGSGDILHRATIAIQQMVGKGVISMEELRQQLGEAVPSAMQIMARSMNMSMAELVGAIESGTVESKSAIGKMLAEMNLTFSGGGARMMTTWGGILQSMETRWKLFLKDMAGDLKDPDSFFNVIKGMTQEMSEWLISSEAKAFAEELAEGLKVLAESMRWLMVTLYENRDAVTVFLKAFATWYLLSKAALVVTSLTGALRAFSLANTGMIRGLKDAGAQFASVKTHIIETNTRLDTSTTRMNTNKIAAVGLGRALKSVGAGFLALLGPMASVAAIGYTIYSTFASIRKESERLVGSILESRGLLSTTEDLERLTDQREKAVDRLQAAQAQLDTYEAQLAAGAGGKHSDSFKAKTEEMRGEVEEYIEEVGKLNLAMTLAEEGLHIQSVAKARSSVDTVINARIDPLRGEFRESRELHAEMLAEAGGNLEKQKRIHQLGIAAADELLAGQKVAIQAERETQLAILDTLDGPLDEAGKQAMATAEASMIALDAKEKEFIADRKNFVEQFNRVNERILKPKKGVPEHIKESERALASMQKILNSFSIKLAKVQGKADETNPHLEALNERIRQLRESLNPSDKTLFDALAKQAQAAAERLFAVEQKIKFEKQGQAAFMQVMGRTASALGDTEEARALKARVQTRELNEQLRVYGELIEKMREWGVAESEIEQFSDSLAEYHKAAMDKIELENGSSWDKMMHEVRNFEADWGGVWKSSMDNALDEMVRFVKEGKLNFSSLVDHMLEQILRIQLQKSMIEPMSELMDFGIKAAGSYFGGSAGAPGSAPGTDATSLFANGGIMTGSGSASLKRYADGGIANSPQVALYGEGSRPEAYVPLPDGRSIPVSMKGGGGVPNIQFNLINQSGQQVESESQGGRFDGETYVLDVVLKAANRPGNFRDGLKGVMK